MVNFVLVDNYTKYVITELENFSLIDVINLVNDFDLETNWFSVYYIENDEASLEAIYEKGNWYDASGYRMLNY